MILSFHPCIEGDQNIICAGREAGNNDLAAIQKAAAVILPQGCRPALYHMARQNCPLVFPNYDARFAYPGKNGQINLFNTHEAPIPKTRCFASLADYAIHPNPIDGFMFPFVFKFDWGGDGDYVLLLEDPGDLSTAIDRARRYEKSGQFGFLIQRLVPAGNRSLRVVVINQKYISYWRVADTDGFYSNLSKGSSIDRYSDPQLQAAGVEQTKILCRRTGIDLAGVDLLFDHTQSEPVPYFIEINFFFGRKGLGGSQAYYDLLETEISNWLRRHQLA